MDSQTIINLGISINPPEDWQGNKYFYDGSEWSVNPDWVEPA